MEFIKAIILGFIQGLTEFLPVSSSGHLAIMKHILHMNLETGLLFDVLLHLGTLIAIFIAFWKDIKELIIEGIMIFYDLLINIGRWIINKFSKNQLNYKQVVSTSYRRFVVMIIVSTIPTAVIGFLFQDGIELAGEQLLVPGLSLILTSILLTISDRINGGSKREDTAGFKDAGLIGIAQGIATLPGLSRSGTTITACLLCGFDRDFAVKYSFIMSIPAVLGAVLLELKDVSMVRLDRSEIYGYLAGAIVAGFVGYLCIKTMLNIVRGKKFKYFAYYCFIIGIIAVICHFVV
ncbi:MAG: undecaprenyl-diphosphate phosphatase [Clostridiales bacterium]|nr:undecaprenyl-diphosphate phosphatase [Clostridiales bacterium]